MRVVIDLEQIISNASLLAYNDELRHVSGASVATYVNEHVVAALANHGVEIVKPEAQAEPEAEAAKTAGELAMDRVKTAEAAEEIRKGVIERASAEPQA